METTTDIYQQISDTLTPRQLIGITLDLKDGKYTRTEYYDTKEETSVTWLAP